MKLKAFMLACLSFVAMAEDRDMRWGMNYLWGEATYSVAELNASELEADPTAYFFNFGYEVTDNFGVEARWGGGVSSGTISVEDEDLTMKASVDKLAGLYAKLHTTIGENFQPYVIAGMTKLDVKVSDICANCGSYTESESDVGFGIGFDVVSSRGAAFNLEAMKYLDKNGLEFSGFSIGFGYRF